MSVVFRFKQSRKGRIIATLSIINQQIVFTSEIPFMKKTRSRLDSAENETKHAFNGTKSIPMRFINDTFSETKKIKGKAERTNGENPSRFNHAKLMKQKLVETKDFEINL